MLINPLPTTYLTLFVTVVSNRSSDSASNRLHGYAKGTTADCATTSKDINHPRSGVEYFPSAVGVENRVVVPRALASCISESAVLKFAAKKPFVVHVNDHIGEYSVLYGGDEHSFLPIVACCGLGLFRTDINEYEC
jgi:hypothetical protein